MDNSYRMVTLEEFVKELPQDEPLLCVGQRQSLRSLVPDIINLIQSQQGDLRHPTRSIYRDDRDGSVTSRINARLTDRTLVYKGEEHSVLPTKFAEHGFKQIFEAIPDVAFRANFSGTVVFSSLLRFPTGRIMVMKTLNPQKGSEELWSVCAFEIKTTPGLEEFTITDALNAIVPTVEWLHRFNLIPVQVEEYQELGGTLDPWKMPEETYMKLLSKNPYLEDTYLAKMAMEMLAVRQGINLVKPCGPTFIYYLYFPQD